MRCVLMIPNRLSVLLLYVGVLYVNTVLGSAFFTSLNTTGEAHAYLTVPIFCSKTHSCDNQCYVEAYFEVGSIIVVTGKTEICF